MAPAIRLGASGPKTVVRQQEVTPSAVACWRDVILEVS